MFRANTLYIDQNWKLPVFETILQNVLFGYLNDESRAILAMALQQFDDIPCYHKAAELTTQKLLQHTAKGEAKEAEEMAFQNSLLVLNKASFTEEWCGQRKWTKPISPLEYTAWCGDAPLRRRYLLSIPVEYKQEALLQLQDVKKYGTEYGEILLPVYRLQQKYNDFMSKITQMKARQKEEFWFSQIGKSQLLSGAYFLQCFCAKYTDEFKLTYNLNPIRSCRIATRLVEREKLELSSQAMLGISFALYKDPTIDEPLSIVEPANYFSGGRGDANFKIIDIALSQFCLIGKARLDADIILLEKDLKIKCSNQNSKYHNFFANSARVLQDHKLKFIFGGIGVIALGIFSRRFKTSNFLKIIEPTNINYNIMRLRKC